jgi:hypothetical protein
MARDYRSEYDNYHARPEQKKNRASRNAARAKMAKAGKVKKGDGKDVSHRNNNAQDSGPLCCSYATSTALTVRSQTPRHT